MSEKPRRGLPGGVVLPAVVLAACTVIFVVCWRNPDLVDLGPKLSASGIGVLGGALSLFWLLAAIGMRRPSK